MSTSVLVTGATGFVGANLVRRLCEMGGYRVRVLVRPHSDTRLIDDLPLERVPGDVTDYESVLAAMRGVEQVYHVAGMVSFWNGDTARLMAVNVGGCRHVREAALACGSPRVVHTSSTAGLGYHPDGRPANEDVPLNPDLYRAVAYCRSKYLGEREMDLGLARGLPTISVNPAFVIGAGDLYQNSGGRLVVDVKRGRVPGYPGGGQGFVDVADVVEGHIRAMARGVPGRRYILCGENRPWRDALSTIARIVGTRPPALPVPFVAAYALGATVGTLTGLVGGSKPAFTAELAWVSSLPLYSDHRRMREELDISPTPFEESIRRTYHFYVDRGLLRA